MSILYLLVFSLFFYPPPPAFAYANNLKLDDALRATYTACVGIDDEISHLKTMAGINTAITSVGTAAGIGATVTGFVKQSKDNQVEELEKLIKELEELEKDAIYPTDAEQQAFLTEFEQSYDIAIKDIDGAQAELDKLTKQSKNLGNWRTGLLAANTATNIAGAAIAGTNKVDAELDEQIKNCVATVDKLRASIIQAQLEGLDVSEANAIADACDDYATVDTSKINKRATGAMASSIVGAATGLAGTVVSGVANTDKTRDDNTDFGKQREKNLNTAANALSIGATAASVTATVFNATQIAAIKKVAAVSEKCTGVLK